MLSVGLKFITERIKASQRYCLLTRKTGNFENKNSITKYRTKSKINVTGTKMNAIIFVLTSKYV